MIYPIEPRNQFGKTDITYWEGFFSEEEINKILALPNWIQSAPASVGGATEIVHDSKVRESNVSWLDLTSDTAWIYAKLSNVIAEVNKRYYHYELTGFYESIQLGVYSSVNKGHYDWHTDSTPFDPGTPRKLSMALLLSDTSEFEGGDLELKPDSDEAKAVQQAKGRAYFFPSYMLHRVTPVTKGVRRSMVVWVGGPPFR